MNPPPPEETPLPSTLRRKLEIGFAVLGALVFYGSLYRMNPDFLGEDKLSWRSDPAGLTLRFVDRELAFDQALSHFTPPVRVLYEAHARLGSDAWMTSRLAMDECEAYLKSNHDTSHELKLDLAQAVLAGEQGDTASLNQRLQRMANRDGNQAHVRRLRDAYADPPRQVLLHDAESTAEMLPGLWFYSTLMARFADSRGDADEAERWRSAAISEILDRRVWIHGLSLVGIVLTLAGLVALWLQRKSPAPPVALPVPWTTAEAFNSVVWGGVAGILLTSWMWDFITDNPALEPLSYFMTMWFFLPSVVIFYFRHCRTQRIGLRDVLGLRPSFVLMRAALIVLLIDSITGLALFGILESFMTLPSAIEGLGEEVIWSENLIKAIDTLDAALGAGIFEELVYRGILFLGLRRYFGFTAAALISSLMFTIPHMQYGWVGLLSVGVFGVIMAWSVERYQSLLPAIFTHAMFNLTISIWQWVLYA